MKVIPEEKLSRKAKKNLKKIREVLEDDIEEIVPIRKGSLKKESYQEQEDDWGEDETEMPSEESVIRQFQRDFVGEGLTGQTDLSEDLTIMMQYVRMLEEDYGKRFPELKLENFAPWMEKHRLSLNRLSRAETVESARGNLSLKPEPEGPPLRF